MDDTLTPAEQAQAEQHAKAIAALLLDEAGGDALVAIGLLTLIRQEWAQNTTKEEHDIVRAVLQQLRRSTKSHCDMAKTQDTEKELAR